MQLLRGQAEALAAPWAAPPALRAAALHPDPVLLRPWLRERLTLHGLAEQTDLLLQQCWPPPAPLWSGLIAQARRLLQPDRGGRMRLCPDRAEPGRELLAWRFISLRLPPGLLIAAAADPDAALVQPTVQLLDPSIRPAGPWAHLHLHLMAAGHFELLWAHLQARRHEPDPHELKSKRAHPPDLTAEEWLALLRRARLARRWLAEHLDMPAIAAAPRYARDRSPAVAELMDAALAELGTGQFSPAVGRRDAWWRACIDSPPRRRHEPRTVAEVWARDPLYQGRPWPEGRFLIRCFDHLRSATRPATVRSPTDHGFARLLIQYLRVKTLLYQLLVQDPAQSGLGSFVATFDRLQPYREGLEPVLPEAAFDECDPPAAVELRRSPPVSLGALHAWTGHATGSSGLPQAWIVHLIRDRTPDPRRQARDHQNSLHPIRQALQTHPGILRHLRGLDLAGNEEQGPLWTALPALREALELSRQAAQQADVAPLRLTLHVGESFQHLATGLRAVHEPYLWQLMQRGDRLGHALALGLDAERWCATHSRVMLPCWERLLDLCWLLQCCEQELPRRLPPAQLPEGWNASRLHLQGELRRLAAALWPRQPPSLDELLPLHRRLGARSTQEALLFAHSRSADLPSPLSSEWIIHQYLREPAAYRVPVEVETGPELPVLRAVQQLLIHLIGRWQTAIEVNPTSNLLIGGLAHPLQQPAFLPWADSPAQLALPICLSADDPLVFATALGDELAYAWAGMVVAHAVSPTTARHWLAEAMATGWRNRFAEHAAGHPA